MISYIKQQLSNRWGSFSCKNTFEHNGNLPYMANGLAFNYIFRPISSNAITERYSCELPADLHALYGVCNGMRLFLSSFCIFGVQTRAGEMEPFDIATENHNIHARMIGNNCEIEDLVFFGSLGKDTVFAFDRRFPNSYLCMKNGSSSPIKTFNSLAAMFDWFIPRLMKLYNDDCSKVFPNEKYKKIPALANAILSYEELNNT